VLRFAAVTGGRKLRRLIVMRRANLVFWCGGFHRVLPHVRALAAGREADERLFVTTTGHQLHASAFKRTLAWSLMAEGQRILDLGHTAACSWLARRVDPVTVQAWMGHSGHWQIGGEYGANAVDLEPIIRQRHTRSARRY
jgi:hypothetical protein